MARAKITFETTIERDSAALDEAIRTGYDRPILLWGHPEVGRATLVEHAARSAGLPFRRMRAQDIEGWDGFRDVSDSGHFRQVSLEKFLAKGERADPNTFTLRENEVLFIAGLNEIPTRLVATVFEQILDEHKLLNNPLPAGARLIASVYPFDPEMSMNLLGEALHEVWNGLDERSSLRYPIYNVPKSVLERCTHWAVLPSVRRFTTTARARGLAEEVVRFLEELTEADETRAVAALHAGTLQHTDPFTSAATPRSFIDLGELLNERRLYFSGRPVKDALARSETKEQFIDWLRSELRTWDADKWIEEGASQTVLGESVPGSVWLRHLQSRIETAGDTITVEDVIRYAAHERRSLQMWAIQELGDDLGNEFMERTVVTPRDVAHLT